MREILFRGKRIDIRGKRTEKGEWVEGSFVAWHDGSASIDTGKLDDPMYAVDPATAGQYTGLTDKNGKRIWEGDIVRYNTDDDFDCHSVVKFGEYEQDGSNGEYDLTTYIGWYVEVDNFTCPDWAENDPTYFRDYLKTQNLLEVSDKCEVIGNIYDDNQELLKGGERNG